MVITTSSHDNHMMLLCPTGWPHFCIMKGHVGKVTSLLYPNTFSDRYDSNLLLSGGEDFTVRLWNLYNGTLLHTFTPHAGPVTNLMVVPKNISVSRCYILLLLLFLLTLLLLLMLTVLYISSLPKASIPRMCVFRRL